MLKIKDSVDLEELERFGFKLDKDEWYVKDITGINIFIKPISKRIAIKAYNTSQYGEIGILYDLMKANLIEKVEG